jgi:hypothetical protein
MTQREVEAREYLAIEGLSVADLVERVVSLNRLKDGLVLYGYGENGDSIDALLAAAAEKSRRDDECVKVREAVIRVFGPGECACIHDLPGDNYTCTAHQLLRRVARGE